MKKSAFLLAALITLSTSLPNFSGVINTSTTTFKDVEKHWGKSYIDRLYKEGYVKGSNGNFNPNQSLKTEDFLIMAVKTIKPEYKDLTASEGQLYYTPFIEKAKEIGLVGQYDEIDFYTNRSIPRELAAQLTTRTLELRGEKVVANKDLAYKFGDYKIINDSNKEAVLKAYQLGIIKGNKGNFEPKDLLTRAESAVLISKIIDKTLREPVTAFVNPKTYGDIDEWYLTAYDKMVQKRAVVIERKANGVINDGDVDFKEIRKWWTDQEFEDIMSANITSIKPNTYTSSMMGANLGSDPSLDYTGGTYYVHDGELAFVNKGQENTQKSYKLYNFPMKNAPRLFYDLSKYGAQYAKEKGVFSQMIYYDGYVYHGIGGGMDPNSIMLAFVYYEEKDYRRNSPSVKFKVSFTFEVADYELFLRHEVFIKQSLLRIYGVNDGQAVFDMTKKLLKNRNTNSVGSEYKTVNGVQLLLDDVKGFKPFIRYSTK
ncbi:MAG: S-layer homology domain-containing protein [Nanoarchaeota archaeon]|nr:S-layer homology domain-containing protein [Nanoarchaeota archaeon]